MNRSFVESRNILSEVAIRQIQSTRFSRLIMASILTSVFARKPKTGKPACEQVLLDSRFSVSGSNERQLVGESR